MPSQLKRFLMRAAPICCTQWGQVIEALREAFDPDIVLRIGTRYVDRIVGDQFKTFESLIKPELLGSAIAKLKRHLKYSLS